MIVLLWIIVMTDTINTQAGQMRMMQCGSCGVWHAFPETIYDHCRREGGHWTCPNGHSRGWAKGADQEKMVVLERERDRLVQNAAQLQDEIRLQERRALAAEQKYKQAHRRAVAGVCPCCNRTFQNVQRHMLSKHKNVVPLDQKTA